MVDVLTPYDDIAAKDAVVAASRLWLERAVIGLNLCPFAKAVYVKEQIRYAVTAATTVEDLRLELTHELELLASANAAEIDTTLLIHPLVLGDFLDYHLFVEEAGATIQKLDLDGVVQIASFHPRYEFADSARDDMANYTNRSPYPMLHLLREESVDRAVAAFPDASVIYEANIDAMRRLGHEGWRQLWLPDPSQA